MDADPHYIRYSERVIFRIIDALIAAVVFILALRLVLRLLGASPASRFAAWLYGTTDTLLTPFTGIFPSLSISGGHVIEFSTVFAVIAYAFLGWLLMKLLDFLINTILCIEHF